MRKDSALTPLPPELEALDDAEIVQLVREAFQTEVGEALDSVRILARGGIVTLAGEVANDSLPEIARRIVEDEVGYEVVDRILVTDTAGGPEPVEDDSGVRHVVPDDTLSIDDEEIDQDLDQDLEQDLEEDLEQEISDDILETEEEGLVYVPPTRPVPER